MSEIDGCLFHERFWTLKRRWVCVPSSLLSNFLERVHVSEPWSNICSTVALKISSFMDLGSREVQIWCMSLHADHAIPFLVLKSFSEEEMKDPR